MDYIDTTTPSKGGGKSMWTISPQLLTLAKQAAEDMVRSGESHRTLTFPGTQGSYILTTDAQRVVATASFELASHIYYLGPLSRTAHD